MGMYQLGEPSPALSGSDYRPAGLATLMPPRRGSPPCSSFRDLMTISIGVPCRELFLLDRRRGGSGCTHWISRTDTNTRPRAASPPESRLLLILCPNQTIEITSELWPRDLLSVLVDSSRFDAGHQFSQSASLRPPVTFVRRCEVVESLSQLSKEEEEV
jgi:hypothetical protein